MKRVLSSALSLILFVSLMPTYSAKAADITRSTIDRSDDFKGYQIHVFYVVPKDGTDENRDTNGEIDESVNDAQRWLQKKIGHQLLIDTYQGKVDITFLKSKYSTKELCSATCDALAKLAAEARSQDPNIPASKTLYFQFSETLDDKYCGWALGSSNLALGFHTKTNCSYASSLEVKGISDPASTFLHEIFHTYGVEHVCQDRNDLMVGTPQCKMEAITSGKYIINLDESRTNYIGGELSGSNILKMPVWSDKSGQDSYALRSAISGNKNFPQFDTGQVFAIVGEKSGVFNWEWNKPVDLKRGDIDCTIYSGISSVKGETENSGCYFYIPNTWSVGTEFKVEMNFSVGPFRGSATGVGMLARSDYSTKPCTQNYCFPGGSIEILACWSSNVKKAVIQEFVKGKWIQIHNSKIIKNDKTCSTDTGFPVSSNAQIIFSKAGNRYLRWYIPTSPGSSEYKGKAFAVIVKSLGSAEPSVGEVSSANKVAISLGKTVKKG